VTGAATRAKVCFMYSEHFYAKRQVTVGCALYLEGLRIITQESASITPLDYLQLCVAEEHILRTYVLGLVPAQPNR
jgi:hypothetical protein